MARDYQQRLMQMDPQEAVEERRQMQEQCMAEVEQNVRLLGYETQWKQEDIDTRRDAVNERSCT